VDQEEEEEEEEGEGRRPLSQQACAMLFHKRGCRRATTKQQQGWRGSLPA
jgi:hypothetical protein